MANGSDTLNIGSIQLRKEFPIAEVQAVRRNDDPVIHPKAAAAARARIAASEDHHPLPNPESVPATPTTSLITDKTVLAGASYNQPLVRGRKLPSALVPLLTAVGIFLLVLLLFKAPIIISTITIPKINVHAPVQYEPSVQEAAVQKALESGVVHYGNTAVPGQAGNVAIFGHSSNDWWEPGNFKFVFVLLDKLSPGDHITLDYQSKRYTYEVIGSKVVEPTNVGVLNPTATPTLTLITCTPPGTSLRRLVLTAKQIDPDPSTSTKVAATPASQTPTTLTDSKAPSFLSQLGQALQGVISGISSLFGGGSGSDKNPSTSATPSQLPAIK
jgi:LPXTG-site transpeptidase (sortase) family protein